MSQVNLVAMCRSFKLELEVEEMEGNVRLNQPHNFVMDTFFKPTYCDHDGSLLSGLFNQGYRCKSCDLNVHEECKKFVPPNCGVNKLAQALIISQQKPEIICKNSTEGKSEEETEQMKTEILKKIKVNTELLLSQKKEKQPFLESETTDDFRFIKTIGKGTFGKVILAEHKIENGFYAIKVVHKSKIVMDDEIQKAFTERDILALGSGNSFLTNLHSTFQNSNHIFFVMEYIDGGDLMFHLMQTGRFIEERARFYTAELVLALQILHSKGIIYRQI